MKKLSRILSFLLVLCMIFSLLPSVYAGDIEQLKAGKTVILHSNDVHGEVTGYAYMAALKTKLQTAGAEVILADAGDYSQGETYVSISKGATAVELMNATGYDVVSLGNHEFDYGYPQLKENMEKAEFDVLCSNVLDAEGNPIFKANTIVEKGGMKIGFFGLETPETADKGQPRSRSGPDLPDQRDGNHHLAECTGAGQCAQGGRRGRDRLSGAPRRGRFLRAVLLL